MSEPTFDYGAPTLPVTEQAPETTCARCHQTMQADQLTTILGGYLAGQYAHLYLGDCINTTTKEN